MDPLVIVSPHFDDAVLSAGQLMAGRPDMHLVTVFTACPPEPVSTDFDRRSGFGDALAAIEGRSTEDITAASVVNATIGRLGYLDNQYRNGETPRVDEIAADLRAAVEQSGTSQIVAPFGIHHPDHVLVGEAALRLARDDIDVVLYEELPGRVLWPEQVAHRMLTLAARGLHLAPVFIGEGPLEVKRRAVHAYRSQMWALNRHCLFVPERFHRVTCA